MTQIYLYHQLRKQHAQMLCCNCVLPPGVAPQQKIHSKILSRKFKRLHWAKQCSLSCCQQGHMWTIINSSKPYWKVTDSEIQKYSHLWKLSLFTSRTFQHA